MNIYIAKDSEDNSIGLLLADNFDEANIAFHAIEEIDPFSQVGVSSLTVLLTSTKIDVKCKSMKTKKINAKPLKHPSVFLVIDQNNAPGRVMAVFNSLDDAEAWRDDYCSIEEHTLWYGQPNFECDCE